MLTFYLQLFLKGILSYLTISNITGCKKRWITMELRILKYFLAGYGKSITQTASLLHLTQSALSRQLTRPEKSEERHRQACFHG